jgi:hypothetical protein
MTGAPIADLWTGYQIVDAPGNTYEWVQTANGTASWCSGATAICPKPAT